MNQGVLRSGYMPPIGTASVPSVGDQLVSRQRHRWIFLATVSVLAANGLGCPLTGAPRCPASPRLVNGPLEAYQVARGVLFLNKGLADCGVAHAQSSACS